MRDAAGFEVIESGVPIDVLWFRISRSGNDPEQLLGNINYGSALILIPRGDYFQSAQVIPKAALNRYSKTGLRLFARTYDASLLISARGSRN